MRAYYIDRANAERMVSRLRIWHPYGMAAPLSDLAFGDIDRLSGRCFEFSDGIKTFCESSEDTNEMRELKRAVSAAKQIVFLGFGYYQENLALIKPESMKDLSSMFCTGYGVSDDNKEVISHNLKNWSGRHDAKILISNMKCAELLNHYRARLSA